MRIPCPHPQLSHVEVEGIVASGDKYKISAGGGLFVEIPDDSVEALVRSYNKQGQTAQHAWTKEDGVQTVKLYLENKKLREQIKTYESRSKRSSSEAAQKKREVKSEDVSTPKESPQPKLED